MIDVQIAKKEPYVSLIAHIELQRSTPVLRVDVKLKGLNTSADLRNDL